MNMQFEIWILENLNWMIPIIITVIFSGLNIRLAVTNQKLAENQLKLQNDSFCYQLYDRRMGIYTSIQKVIKTIMQDGTVSVELLSEYLSCTKDVRFLFGEDIADKVDQLYKLMVELHTTGAEVDNNIKMQRASPSHSKLCEREGELLKLITNAGKHLGDVFSPYISFKNYRIDMEKMGK